MLSKLTQYTTVFKNFTALSLLQILQLLVGFLTYPYLIKVLGIEKYGVVAYAQVLTGYMALIVNYGFNATATKDIALNREDASEVEKIVSAVFWCKFFLMILVSIVYVILVYSFTILNQYSSVYLLAGLSILGAWLFPDWVFQGFEKMGYITYSSLIARIFSIIAIFGLVKKPEDLVTVVVINSITTLITALIGIIHMRKLVILRNILKLNLKDVLCQFTMGFAYFFSNIAANSKEYFNLILLGAVLNYQMVGIYDFIKKIINMLVIPCSTVTRAIFPLVVRKNSLLFNKKIEYLLLSYTVLVIFILFLIPDYVWVYFIQNNVIDFKPALYILSLCLPLYALCGSRGFLTLISFGYDKVFSKNVLFSVLSYFILISSLWLFGKISLITVSLVIVLSLLIEAMLHSYQVGKRCEAVE